MPNPSVSPGSSNTLLQKNVNDLARVIASEAGGESEAAQTMVGWTVVNRMKQRGYQAVIHKYDDVIGGTLYSDKAARTAARTLNAALLDHPALYAPVCQMSIQLLSRFHNGPDVPDITVPVQLLIESVDMDIRDHGHCVHDLIAALPTDEANIKIRLGAHALCVNDDNNHRRTRAACDTLIPGMTDPGLDP